MNRRLQVTVMPRFCVVNCFDMDVSVRQAGAYQTPLSTIHDNGGNKLISLQV